MDSSDSLAYTDSHLIDAKRLSPYTSTKMYIGESIGENTTMYGTQVYNKIN